MNNELSTLRLAIYLLIGLTVFTGVVAGLSTFRYKRVAPAHFEAADIDETRKMEGPSENEERPDEPAKAGNEGKGFAVPDLSPLIPDLSISDEPILEITYDENRRPILPGRISDTHPRTRNWRATAQRLINRVFHYRVTPGKTGAWVTRAGQEYLKILRVVERHLRRSGGMIYVRCRADLEQRAIEAKANYLGHLKVFMNNFEDGMPGMPACSATMPVITDMTYLPPLPPFDPKMRAGEDAIQGEYVLGSQMPDPFETLAKLRDHVNMVLSCVRNVDPNVEYPTGIVEIFPEGQGPKAGGVPLPSPGEAAAPAPTPFASTPTPTALGGSAPEPVPLTTTLPAPPKIYTPGSSTQP